MSYNNIPGVNVKIKDGGLVIPERGGSESVLILAPSLKENAPTEPVRIRSSVDLEQQGFGGFYIGGAINPIAAEWKAAADAGCKVIYLAAIKEIDMERAAELERDAGAGFEEVLTGEGALPKKRREFIHFYELMLGTLLDFTVDHIVVKGFTLEDEVDELTGAFFPEVENSDNFPNIAGIVSSSHVLVLAQVKMPFQVTAEENDLISLRINGRGPVDVKVEAKQYETGTDLANAISKALTEHETAVKNKVFEENGVIAIHLTEEATLEDATTFTKTPASRDTAMSNKTTYEKTPQGVISKGSFARTIADYCETKTLLKQATIGYIGVNGPSDTKVSTIRKYVDELDKLDTEVSPYLQVVGSQTGVVLPGTNSTYFTNGATHYAALVSTLRPESAPTNKEIPGVSAIRFEYSLRQLSKLTSKKIVTFRIKDGTQLVVTDGITTAPQIQVGGKLRSSDFTRLSTLRITQLAIDVVREAVDPYIGEANEIPQYNSIQTAIKSSLEKIREAGAIRGYDFSITNVTAELDHAVVLLSLVPAFELRRVDVEVNLSTSDEVLESLIK